MLTNVIFTISLAVVTMPCVVVLATSDINGAYDNDLLQVMRSIPYFSLMVNLIETARIDTLFEDESTRRTVFVPMNNAFLDVRTDLMIHFLTDQKWKLHLCDFLKHHMSHKEIDMVAIASSSETRIDTFNHDIITIESYHDDIIIVNSFAKFAKVNMMASNGVIQAIDNVLVPTWYDKNIADLLDLDPIRFSTLVGVGVGNKNKNFMDAISSSSWEPYTMFAPTNKAFSDSEIFDDLDTHNIQNVLDYHIVPGIHTGIDLMQATVLKSSTGELLKVEVDSAQRTLRINGSLIIQSNILANNGIVHIIDGLLIPSLNQENKIPINDPVDIPTLAQTTERNVHLTEPRCGCSSCPLSCGARVQWLKNNEMHDEVSACSKLLTEKPSPLDCEQCDPDKCSSYTDLKTTALRNEEYKKCFLLKNIEETRGDSQILCNCQQLGDDKLFFELVCKGETNTTCSPKYAACDTGEHCCSNPLRRCTGGQCRDALRPKRERRRGRKIGFGGGLTSRTKNSLFDHRKTRNKEKFSF